MLLGEIDEMQHCRAELFQYAERQQRENEQGYDWLPRIDDRVSVQCLIDINQEVMPKREQYGQALQGGVHCHNGVGEAGNGEGNHSPQ